jgi:hypothetical protein
MEMEIEVPEGPYCAQQFPGGKDGKPEWRRCQFLQKAKEHWCDAFKTSLQEAAFADEPLFGKCAACHSASKQAEMRPQKV